MKTVLWLFIIAVIGYVGYRVVMLIKAKEFILTNGLADNSNGNPADLTIDRLTNINKKANFIAANS